ncbi:sugar ABC transporter substrate-binding protein [Verminephrobacter aporrectodeae subsp. tuberculatae]|uniref:Sugar ABC transporter substrate-binding protein n=1 Tax=Verminephrobacter aporrectodeae subsp. tuberculatae TaxID=1110392 RepID=A0ABT3KVA8_9BURK|nr:sugar ABC transporter substrate-binding protein [Verminephrobacter aporrectodeae]MCW5322273.1 sugar ABC transporter substrate-binding protein [Verminephrobacter aporrectodeae subsp. tuberculatae]MCW8207019.1 sugar ABC transporter substrate-binding protein [Verminephrobacter aporrectodeae subsp. tuberculatae]
MKRRGLLQGVAAGAALGPWVHTAAQDRYAKYRGQTLVVNYPAHPHYDQAEKLFAEFSATTGIRIERDKMQYLRMKDKQVLEMGKKGHGDYDVIVYVVMWKTEYVKKNLLESLEPYFGNKALADPAWDQNDIITRYWETNALVGGPKTYLPGPGARPYGIPFGAETGVLAYRADILEKHGIAVPKTYDELLRACHTIKDREGIGGLSSRGQTGHQVTAAWLLHLTPHGGEVFDSNWRAAFNNAQGVRAAEILREIVATGPAGIPSYGFGEMQNAFLQGQAAMYLDSVSVFGPVRDPAKSKIVGKVGYAVHPRGTQHSAQSGGFALAIPRNARNKDAAFLFMQWMTSKQADLKIGLAGGNINRWSTVDNADVGKKYAIEIPALRAALKITNPDWRPLIPEWDHISQQILGQALSDVIAGSRPAKQALDAVVKNAEDVLRKGGWIRN